ncbi:MAG: hypothetical protein B6D61_02210 [Bacteroidetes bacterium 4484_249]|nr:MAG: hypothetical protein B6D61_02210 [Bacteroidetes bacterium 4484_249]
MINLSPYLKIIRIPNLLIIILTQYLLRICVIQIFYSLGDVVPAVNHFDFALLVFSTLLIAAGGNVINDYFDEAVDKINKPDKILIGKSISRTSAYIYYWVLTIPGIIIGFYLAIKVDYLQLGFVYVAIAIMLWFYSERYQRKVLWGNLIVSALSAMVILIVWLFEFFALKANPFEYVETIKYLKPVSLIVIVYAVFAFFTSIIREIFKDIEDMEGDKSAGYRTLAIVAGLKLSKLTGLGLILILMTLIGVSQYFLWQEGFNLVFWYLLIAVQTLLLFVIYNALKSKTKEDYHFLSNAMKIIMVAGILSMELFYASI